MTLIGFPCLDTTKQGAVFVALCAMIKPGWRQLDRKDEDNLSLRTACLNLATLFPDWSLENPWSVQIQEGTTPILRGPSATLAGMLAAVAQRDVLRLPWRVATQIWATGKVERPGARLTAVDDDAFSTKLHAFLQPHEGLRVLIAPKGNKPEDHLQKLSPENQAPVVPVDSAIDYLRANADVTRLIVTVGPDEIPELLAAIFAVDLPARSRANSTHEGNGHHRLELEVREALRSVDESILNARRANDWTRLAWLLAERVQSTKTREARVAALAERAHVLLRHSSDLGDAARTCIEVLSLEPTNAIACGVLSELLETEAISDKATLVEIAKKTLADPLVPAAIGGRLWGAIAWSQHQTHDYVDALHSWRHARRHSPLATEEEHIRQAKTLIELGMTQEAVVSLIDLSRTSAQSKVEILCLALDELLRAARHRPEAVPWDSLRDVLCYLCRAKPTSPPVLRSMQWGIDALRSNTPNESERNDLICLEITKLISDHSSDVEQRLHAKRQLLTAREASGDELDSLLRPWIGLPGRAQLLLEVADLYEQMPDGASSSYSAVREAYELAPMGAVAYRYLKNGPRDVSLTKTSQLVSLLTAENRVSWADQQTDLTVEEEVLRRFRQEKQARDYDASEYLKYSFNRSPWSLVMIERWCQLVAENPDPDSRRRLLSALDNLIADREAEFQTLSSEVLDGLNLLTGGDHLVRARCWIAATLMDRDTSQKNIRLFHGAMSRLVAVEARSCWFNENDWNDREMAMSQAIGFLDESHLTQVAIARRCNSIPQLGIQTFSWVSLGLERCVEQMGVGPDEAAQARAMLRLAWRIMPANARALRRLIQAELSAGQFTRFEQSVFRWLISYTSDDDDPLKEVGVPSETVRRLWWSSRREQVRLYQEVLREHFPKYVRTSKVVCWLEQHGSDEDLRADALAAGELRDPFRPWWKFGLALRKR